MIEITTTHACGKCHSNNIIKNGKNVCGSQQYRCKDCGACAVLQPKFRYSPKDKEMIIRAYQQRSSMRGIERTFGICRPNFKRLVKKKANPSPKLSQTLLNPTGLKQTKACLELDQLWSFVGYKKNKVWVWIALERTS